MKKFYFDYAATTPVDKRVVKAMIPYQSEVFGNPGSLHKFGQEASSAVFKARNKISRLINCDYREIIFTGSATEANNLAIRGIVKGALGEERVRDVGNEKIEQAKRSNKRNDRTIQTHLPRIITSQIEHESILETCQDLEKSGLAEVVYLPVNKAGIIDLKKLRVALNERTVLVSIMYANNEVGSIQPIKEIAKIINDFKIKNLKFKIDEKFPIFHCDAVQAFNYLDCNVKDLGVDPVRNHARACAPEGPMGRAISNGVDLMTLSSQKIYGPKGVGLLYINNFGGIFGEKFIKPVITGGHQEENLRAGTENVAGIVGFAEAAQIASDLRRKESVRLLKLQNYFWKNIKKNCPGVLLNGPAIGGLPARAGERLPNNIDIYFPGQKGLIYKLDMAGFAVSSGSACSARLAKPSHVLKALGFSDEKASESLRISFGRQTDKVGVDKLLKILKSASLHQ